MKSGFWTKLILEDDLGFPYTLATPLVYTSALLRRVIVVPTGFRTDLASIPAIVQLLIPKSGAYDKAAVVHDYLYVKNGVSREEADAVLREAMEVLGVGGFKRWAIYRGVRAGGWLPWKRYRDADERAERQGADGADAS